MWSDSRRKFILTKLQPHKKNINGTLKISNLFSLLIECTGTMRLTRPRITRFFKSRLIYEIIYMMLDRDNLPLYTSIVRISASPWMLLLDLPISISRCGFLLLSCNCNFSVDQPLFTHNSLRFNNVCIIVNTYYMRHNRWWHFGVMSYRANICQWIFKIKNNITLCHAWLNKTASQTHRYSFQRVRFICQVPNRGSINRKYVSESSGSTWSISSLFLYLSVGPK